MQFCIPRSLIFLYFILGYSFASAEVIASSSAVTWTLDGAEMQHGDSQKFILSYHPRYRILHFSFSQPKQTHSWLQWWDDGGGYCRCSPWSYLHHLLMFVFVLCQLVARMLCTSHHVYSAVHHVTASIVAGDLSVRVEMMMMMAIIQMIILRESR